MTTVSPDDLFAELSVAPAVSLNVSTLSPRATRKPVVRGVGEVSVNLLHGDCLAVMKTLEDNSVDSIVTDPPYGLAALPSEKIMETMVQWCSGNREFIPEGAGFMGRTWDAFIPPPAVWDEVFRVLKPGGHLVAFAGSRTQDLMGIAVRLAGFEIRDNLAWLYGSGFPKNMDVSKQIDKMHGAEPIDTGIPSARHNSFSSGSGNTVGFQKGVPNITAPATPDAEYWQGWGTALKPAFEPVILARKPLSESTVAQNVLTHGTGAINIDACRIGLDSAVNVNAVQRQKEDTAGMKGIGGSGYKADHVQDTYNASGRFPANIMLDRAAADELDKQSGVSKSSAAVRNNGDFKSVAKGAEKAHATGGHDDQGGASRFFMVADEDELDVPVPFHYSAKAPKAERPVVNGVAHVTVKPLSTMRWLVKLITPPGGTVLEPFAGSGTTVEAAIIEGFDVIAIEREDEYIPLIEERVNRQLRKSSAA